MMSLTFFIKADNLNLYQSSFNSVLYMPKSVKLKFDSYCTNNANLKCVQLVLMKQAHSLEKTEL